MQSCRGKVALALDAWTSPNQHLFLAITGHYINRDFQLCVSFIFFSMYFRLKSFAGEALLAFDEIEGAHTGENLAEVVMNELTFYELEHKVHGVHSA